MLILERKVGETLVINNQVFITILKDKVGNIKLGIDAPRETLVDRLEIFHKRQVSA